MKDLKDFKDFRDLRDFKDFKDLRNLEDLPLPLLRGGGMASQLLYILDIIEEEGVGSRIEFLEILGTLLVGVGSEELLLIVAPSVEIADGIAVENGLEHPRPPCGVGDILVATLGDGDGLAILLGE